MEKESKDGLLKDINREALPYRKGVGLMIVNKEKKILLGKRIDTKIEAWQMPQGGIDIGETPSKAAMREMKEEIGCSNARIIAESKNWYSYELPDFLIPKLWKGAYRGQQQKWFLIQFKGKDEDINVNTENPEFVDWKWESLKNITKIIVPFKKKLYNSIFREFESFFK